MGSSVEAHGTPPVAWDVALGHGICADLDQALGREWLVTNGIGGFAMGALCGATTRRYHGLLVAALRPPVARTVLVTKCDEVALLPDGTSLALGTDEYADGTLAPAGYGLLDEFALEGSVARWRFRLAGDIVLEQRVWMERARNLTYVRYTLVATPTLVPSTAGVTLTLATYCVARDYHVHQHGRQDWRFLVDALPGGCLVRATADAPAVRLLVGPAAQFTPTGVWYWNLLHRAERERGLDDTEDVYQPGTFSAALQPGDSLTLALAADDAIVADGIGLADHERLAAAALVREHARTAELLRRAARTTTPLDPVRARLCLAADQFLVARAIPGPAGTTEAGSTVMAGYPWFTDWGRDTMIALSGLTLPTGRHVEARRILRTFARFLDRGMLPNRFPDGGEALGDDDYNTADATLWLFVALDRYLDATGDSASLAELFPALAGVIEWHQRGTRFGIAVDVGDGLLRSGAPGVQLTWMDAKVGDWVVTPRRGKPVEINGLWHEALALMTEWAERLGQPAGGYAAARDQVAASFGRFWYSAGGYLYDVLDVEGNSGALDAALRPNQAIALAMRHCPVPPGRARQALTVVERDLLTPLGLRTLSPHDPAFQPHFAGDQRQRDGAYHQGTVWPWLIGPYLDARLRLARDMAEREAVRASILAPFRDHLLAAGVGSISEVAEAVPPFRPAGCIAQAWSVAEVLRLLAAEVRDESA